MLVAVIMAGGSGTRFWPLSRQGLPKQFLKITSDQSMLQLTAKRLQPRVPAKHLHVVTSAQQRGLVLEHLRGMPEENVVVEPFPMNTAAAIGLSALALARKYRGNDHMLVLPADHAIDDTAGFLRSLDPGQQAAAEGNLVTFGIKPTCAATGYGYIEAGETLGEGPARSVKNFKEKPDQETAEYFFESGSYFWNSGIFLWQIDSILAAFKRHLPKAFEILERINAAWELADAPPPELPELYAQMPKVPVDIGIMERAENRVVIPVDYGWSDVGGWNALHDLAERDRHDNVVRGPAELLDSHHNYVHCDKLVALVGVDNLVVVDTPDALLIVRRDQAERVKDIVSNLESRGLDEYL